MEKKSLGRGLEDIADIFISQKNQPIPPDDISSKTVSDVVVGYYPEHPLDWSKKRMASSEEDIQTREDKRPAVNRHGLHTEQPLEHDFSGKDDDRPKKHMESAPGNNPDVCDIIEHVTSKKEIRFLNTPDVQHNIIKSLSQHLRQNYRIKNIELVKENEVSGPGIKNSIEENILIYIKEEGSQ